MGLDAIELVLEIEQGFGLRIPDGAVQKMFTVGDLIEYVRSNIRLRSGEVCMTSRTFYRFRSELMRVLSLSRMQIHPSGQLAVLIPANERRRVWSQLHDRGVELPHLRISTTVFWLSTILVLAVAAAMVWMFHSVIPLALVLPLGLLTRLITKPFAVHTGPYRTLRDVILYLAPATPKNGETPARLSDEEIADKIRFIISDNLGVPLERVREEASFVEDLGAE